MQIWNRSGMICSRFKKKSGERRKNRHRSRSELRLTDYEEIKDRLDACIKWLQAYPEKLRMCVSRQTHEEDEVGQLTLRLTKTQEEN